MSVLATGAFWAAAAERGVKTVAQTAVALLGTGALGLLDVDWASVLSASGLAGVVSVLTSIASAGVAVGGQGPSLASEELGRHAAGGDQ